MKSLHFTFNGWATLFWFPILCKPLQNMNLLRYNIFSQLQQKKAKKSTPTGSTLFGFVLDNCSSDQVLQSWDRRRCFSKRWLQDAAGKFSMPKGPNAERDEHRGWWAPATHRFGCVYLFAIFCAQICINLLGRTHLYASLAWACGSDEWWLVADWFTVYISWSLHVRDECFRLLKPSAEGMHSLQRICIESLQRPPLGWNQLKLDSNHIFTVLSILWLVAYRMRRRRLPKLSLSWVS